MDLGQSRGRAQAGRAPEPEADQRINASRPTSSSAVLRIRVEHVEQRPYARETYNRRRSEEAGAELAVIVDEE